MAGNTISKKPTRYPARITVDFDPETFKAVEAAAQRLGISKLNVVRMAVSIYVHAQTSVPQ